MSRFFMVHCVRSKILQFYTQICIWIRPRIELYCFLDVNLYIFFIFNFLYHSCHSWVCDTLWSA